MSTSTINLMICGFVLLVVVIVVSVQLIYKRAIKDTPMGYQYGKVVGKTKAQRNNTLTLLMTLIIVIIGSYFLYRYFDYMLMLCPIGLLVAFWLGLMLFALGKYRAAVAMDRDGIPASVTVLDKYREHVQSGHDEHYLILQPPGADVPYQFAVPYQFFTNSNKGEVVQIRYLRGNPKVIRVE